MRYAPAVDRFKSSSLVPAGQRPVHADRPRTVAQCKTPVMPCPAPAPQRLAAPPLPPATARRPAGAV